MKGFIEIKEDSYEDTIEHLHRIKLLACKLIKMLSEHSEVYDKKLGQCIKLNPGSCPLCRRKLNG